MTCCLVVLIYMNSISISDLKINPSKAIDFATDFPLAIQNRNKVKAYLLGKDLYEKMVSYIENMIDKEYLFHFDALSHYKKYTELFDIDSVPEAERKEAAQQVANWVLDSLNKEGI